MPIPSLPSTDLTGWPRLPSLPAQETLYPHIKKMGESMIQSGGEGAESSDGGDKKLNEEQVDLDAQRISSFHVRFILM